MQTQLGLTTLHLNSFFEKNQNALYVLLVALYIQSVFYLFHTLLGNYFQIGANDLDLRPCLEASFDFYRR